MAEIALHETDLARGEIGPLALGRRLRHHVVEGRPGDRVAVRIPDVVAAGELEVSAVGVGHAISEVIDDGQALRVRVEQDRHVLMAGRGVDDLQVAAGVGQHHRARPGVEDRHRRGAQRREVELIEVGQIGVRYVDQRGKVERVVRVGGGVGQRGVDRHRHLQVGERAVALEVGHHRRLGAHAGVAEIARVERVDGEGDVVDRAGRAIAAREGAGGVDGIGGDAQAGLRGRGDVDRRDAGLIQGLEFAGIEHGVAVGVLPDAQ